MKLHTSIVVGAVGMGVMGFAAGSAYVRGQSPSPGPLGTPEIRVVENVYLPSGVAGQYVTSKMLAEDVKLMIFKSDRGVYRAHMFVKMGDRWEPVAAAGLADLKGILPAK